MKLSQIHAKKEIRTHNSSVGGENTIPTESPQISNEVWYHLIELEASTLFDISIS